MQENSKNDQSSHSENLYAYNENESESQNNEPPKESTAIRRSIGREGNPFRSNISNEINGINNKFSNNINHIQSQNINNNARTLSSNNPENLQAPNYDKSSEQRIPPNNFQAPQQSNQINYNKNNNNSNNNSNNNPNNNNMIPYMPLMMIGLLQIVAVIVLAVAYKLGDGDPNKFVEKGKNNLINDHKDFGYYFHYLKDVHLMIFIGFGLLYCSLKDHMISSTALVLFVCIISFEFSLFFNYFWNNTFKKKHHNTRYPSGFSKIKLDMEEITQIDFFPTTVLISLGALIGKLTLGQYLVVICCETLFASFNYFLCYFAIGGIDTGGSLYIFAFGAIFGFMVSFVLAYDNRFQDIMKRSQNNKSSYYSNVISAIGSLFLWLYFPSFNTARIHYDEKKSVMDIMRYRGIINTYMSMMGSLVATFCTSSLVMAEKKFKMEHILRSSYVGGVIIAGSCTFCPFPWTALLIGFFGGIVSVLLMHLATPKEEEDISQDNNNPNKNQFCYNLLSALRMSDTMDVIYTFGIPGILGGIFTTIFLGSLKHEPWEKTELNNFFYYNRSPAKQGGVQTAVFFITIAIAMCSGIITGFFLRFFQYNGEEYFFRDDRMFVDNKIEPEYNSKKILSSSENKLNDEDNEEGREVEVNQDNNNIE